MKNDIIKAVAWISAAAGFAGVLGFFQGFDASVEFCAGYLLEQCLSIDNLFVFLLLFEFFNVKDELMRERVLAYGLWGAVILRGLFILAGTVAIEQSKEVTARIVFF